MAIYMGVPIYNVNQISLRQAITPSALQGRVNATVRFINWSALPVGAWLGGLLGDRIGLQATLQAGAIGWALAVLWIVRSPVMPLRNAECSG
jgi:predicted MFS family arabinose efflux permease